MPIKPKKKKNPEHYHHGSLREAVILRSLDVLEEKGVFALSLRDIAQDLGVSHTAPYKHFPKKNDLLVAIAAEGFRDLSLAMTRAWDFSENPIEKLRKSGEEYIYLLLKFPRRTELMFGGEVHANKDDSNFTDELAIQGQNAYIGMYKIVEYGQVNQALKSNVPTATLMMTYWSLVHGFAVLNENQWKHCKSEEDKEKFQEQVNQVLNLMIEGTKS